MPGAAEITLVLYTGAKPGPGEVRQIVGAIERGIGISLDGTRVSVLGFNGAQEPDTGLAQAVIAQMEGEGELSPRALERAIIRSLSVNGATRIVAVVKAEGDTGGGRVRSDLRPEPRPERGGRGRGIRGRRERNSWARELIPRHLEKLDQAGTSLARRPGWATLSGEFALSFVASAKDGALVGFADVRILVSHFRETEPERIQKRMRGGYKEFLYRVADAAQVTFGDGQPDLAHWILCADRKQHVVHLAYLPDPYEGKGEALLPWDLMPPDELQEIRRIQ